MGIMGSNSPVVPDPTVLGLHLPAPLSHPVAVALSRRVAMARDTASAALSRPWLVDLLPLLIVLLISAHVLALGYWIYRLATDGSRQPARSKKH